MDLEVKIMHSCENSCIVSILCINEVNVLTARHLNPKVQYCTGVQDLLGTRLKMTVNSIEDYVSR